MRLEEGHSKKERTSKFTNKGKMKWSILLLILIILPIAVQHFTNTSRYIPPDKRSLLTADKLNLQLKNAHLEKNNYIYPDGKNAEITFNTEYLRVLRFDFLDANKKNCDLFINGEKKHIKKSFAIADQSYLVKGKNVDVKIVFHDAKSVMKELEVDNRYVLNHYRMLYLYFVEIILSLIILNIKYKFIKKPETAYLALSIMLTVMMSTLLPSIPAVSWDEKTHFANVANMFTPGEDYTDEGAASNYNYYKLYDITNQKEIFEETPSENTRIEGSIDSLDFGRGIKHIYKKIAYVPAGFIYYIACHLLGFGMVSGLIAGRVMNGLVYSFVTYLGIKKIRKHKTLTGALCLCPTFIFLASTYSYDYWVTAFIILGLCYIVDELETPERQLTGKSYLISMLAITIGCGPKPIYAPLALLPILYAKGKYQSNKQKYIYAISSVIICSLIIASFLLPIFIGGMSTGDTRGGSAVNSTDQIQFILNSPLRYAKILMSFLCNYLSIGSIESSVIFLAFIHPESPVISSIVITVTTLTIGFAVVTDCDTEYEKNLDNRFLIFRDKLAFIVMFLGIAALISTALYIDFNPVGAKTIVGVQGRYLFPMLMLPLIAFRSDKIVNRIKPHLYFNSIFLIISMVTCFEFGFAIIRHYF